MIKLKIEGLPAAVLVALEGKMGDLEVILVDDEPRAAALNGAEAAGLDFGCAVAETMSICDEMLADAEHSHHYGDHIVVFDRILEARRAIRSFWELIAASTGTDLSLYIGEDGDADQD